MRKKSKTATTAGHARRLYRFAMGARAIVALRKRALVIRKRSNMQNADSTIEADAMPQKRIFMKLLTVYHSSSNL